MHEHESPHEYNINSPEAIADAKVHEIILEEAFKELARSKPYLYHDPTHTLGESLDGQGGGVLGVTRQLLEVVNMHTTERAIISQTEADTMLAQQLGAEAGAAFHDLVMQIEGTTDESNPLLRKVRRAGGWQEGGNEFESYRILEHYAKQYLDDSDFRDTYLQAAEAAIKATVPKATFDELPADQVEQYSEQVQSLVRGEDGAYRGLLIEPVEPPTTLSGLVLTIADLSAARSPEIFYRTGNAEFWELHYKLAEFAAVCLAGNEPIARADALTLLTQMKQWRKTQVGFALWQRTRLEKNVTPSAIQALAAAESYPPLKDLEAHSIAMGLKEQLIDGMDDSIEDSATRYQTFAQTYCLPEDGEDTLSPDELTHLQDAITELGGVAAELTTYVAHVEAELQGPANR